MEIDVMQTFEDLITGETIRDPRNAENDYTFRDAMIHALASNEDKPNENEKIARYILAIRVRENNVVELTNEEAVKIKDLVGQSASTPIAGKLCPILNNKT